VFRVSGNGGLVGNEEFVVKGKNCFGFLAWRRLLAAVIRIVWAGEYGSVPMRSTALCTSVRKFFELVIEIVFSRGFHGEPAPTKRPAAGAQLVSPLGARPKMW
jgi:hypothetical protein